MRIFEVFKKKNIGIKESGVALVSKKEDNAFFSSEDERIDLWNKYNNAYHNFPLVASAIDVTVDQSIQDFYFEERKTDYKETDFLKKSDNILKIEKFSDEINLLTKLNRIARQMLVFGNCFVEIVSSGKKVKDLKILDPTTMSVIRSDKGIIEGYLQTVGNEKLVWGKIKNIQAKKVGSVNDIAHFKYNVQKAEKYGTGIIHSVLPMLEIKEQVESMLNILLKRYAIPFLDITVGDEEHPPVQSDIDNVDSKVQQLEKETQFVHSYLVKCETKGFEGKAINLEAPLNHIDKQIIAGLQVPPILLGISNGIDRATAEVQLRSFGRHVKSLQRLIKVEFEDKIIKPYFSKNIKLIWGSVEEREQEIDFENIKGLVQANIITPQKANSLLPPKYHEILPNSNNIKPSSKKSVPSLEVPTDPTKSTQLMDGRRVTKSEVKVPIDKKTDGEVKYASV